MKAAAFLLLGALSASPARAAAPAALDEVNVGAYVHDVQNLELKSHSYNVDLYIWFRWRNPALNPAATFEFINPFESWGHVKATDYEKPVRLPDGQFYQVVRCQGRFSSKLPLYDYPFDHQTLVVEFEDSSKSARDLAYVPDQDGVSVNPALELPGFAIGKPALKALPSTYPTNFGDPREPARSAFSRARLELPISRPLLPYSVKLLLPILCVIFCAALMFLFHPKYVDSRVGIGITALLTIVALQITLNDDLPEVAYLVLLDKIYLGAYLFVIAGLAVVVKTTWMIEHGSVPRAIRLDRRSLIVLSVLYLAATAALVYRGLHGLH